MTNTIMQKELKEATSNFKLFTTNQGSNTLKKKLSLALDREEIKFFDVLVGYFRLSGFDKISQSLKNKHTRILVGINTEKNILDATQDSLDDITDNLVKDLQAKIDENQLDNVDLIKYLMLNQRLEIRAVRHNNNHSKLYIYRNENEDSHKSYDNLRGGLFIGSSNFTHNGLIGNFETNINEENQYHIEESTKLFNILWKHADRLTNKDIDEKIFKKLKNYPRKVKEITKENISPYQLYIKALQVYFGDRIDLIEYSKEEMPKDFKSFNYQSDAVQDGIHKLNTYNGFYLADVVGLGKTIIAILIIKRLELQTLVIAPKSVLKQWEKAIKDFDIENIACISKDAIPSSTDAALIVIDEAHNFRNSDTKRYPKLQHICKHPYQKKIMLLSATPQNNEPKDIANQIYLFQSQNNSNIPNLLKLKEFFDAQNRAYKTLITDSSKDHKKALDKISQEIKKKVLKYIMTRRTRTDIESCEMYKSDIESFPKLDKLEPLEYELKAKDLIDKYNETALYLDKKIQYARFKALNKLNENGKAKYKSINPKIPDNFFDENPLAKLMQVQLVKRFESSFEAFKISLNRHIRRLKAFIEQFEKDEIYLGKSSNDFLDDKEKYRIEEDKVSYLSKNGKKKTLKGHIFSKADFADDFLALLEEDFTLFEHLNNAWKNEKRDPKIELFKEELDKYKDSDEKIVVFTESQDTGKYLNAKLSSDLKILYIDSQNRDENIDTIAKNFDANLEKEKQENTYNIIITTDTLAEGINLHRSSTIYNYDIPWNATKLMQRIGRINRIGSEAKSYNVFNFKPVAKSEEILGLSHKAYTKLQSFHSTYGEDNKIYTDDEEVESKELFEIMELHKEEIDEALVFLQEIRTVKENHPLEFTMIQNLPNDIQMSVKERASSYAYKKGDISHIFYKIDKEVEEIDFVSFATGFKSMTKYPKIKLESEYVGHLQATINNYHQKNIIDKIQMQNNDTQNSTNNGKAIRILKSYRKKETISKEIYMHSRKLVEEGVFATLSAEIIESNSENIVELLDRKKPINNKINIENMHYILTCTKGV